MDAERNLVPEINRRVVERSLHPRMIHMIAHVVIHMQSRFEIPYWQIDSIPKEYG